MKNGFFAYPSEPKYCGDTIEDFITKVNESHVGVVEIRSWIDLKISGRFIISEILTEIDNCDFFCVDLTGLNSNVLFELGYAIAKKKIVWIIIDRTNEKSNKRFQELNFFSTIGYTSYRNSNDLITSFAKDEVYDSTVRLGDSLTCTLNLNQDENALLYIKGQVDTNYSQDIINEIERLKLPYLLDDPIETKIQPLTWYLEKIHSVPAILVEYSSNFRVGHELHNSKCAFISGLSLGFGLSLLMVSEKPHPTPIDYKELLKKHENRQECAVNINPFLKTIHDDIAQLLVKKRYKTQNRRLITDLQKVNFGEFIAEHEIENLFEYFIETSHYQNLIKSEHNIVIGRKGTGKTATLYYLERILEKDIRNHICLIKPVNFEIDGLISLYNTLGDDFERGYITEAIWKFLIYSEIAKSLYNVVKTKPLYALGDTEREFIKYVTDNEQIILTDFSTRLEQELEDLSNIKARNQSEFRIKISEILHDQVILDLRQHIRNIVRQNGKLVVLIDNLDKSWKKDNNLEILSKYILGLLGVVGRIAKDFRSYRNSPIKFSFHLTLFLRSDIFKFIMKSAREPDKIEYNRLVWHDPQILFRIIETRFEQLSEKEVFASELWEKYVSKKVKGIDSKDFIINSIFPRPRDIIYFLTSAKNIAVSRGHIKIEEEDLISAHKDYSNWIFKSVIVENGISIEQMGDFMYNLMGERSILTSSELKSFAKKSNIKIESEETLEEFIDHLVSLTILGREIKESQFEYEYEFDSDIKLKTLAKKYLNTRFKVHNALVPYLELIN